MANNNRKKIPVNIIKWILAVFMFSGCLVYWFSFASIIFALLGVYFLPIAPIQTFFNKIMPTKIVLRGIIAFVIFVVGCCVAPQVETATPEVTNPTDITIGIPNPPLRMMAPNGAPMKKNIRHATDRANFLRISMSILLSVKT